MKKLTLILLFLFAPSVGYAACTDNTALTVVGGATACPGTTLAALLPIYDISGNLKAPSHGVVGSCTLAVGVCTITLTGNAVFTSTSTYTCNSSDQNTAATLSSIALVSGAQFTVYGTLTHLIDFSCTGW